MKVFTRNKHSKSEITSQIVFAGGELREGE